MVKYLQDVIRPFYLKCIQRLCHKGEHSFGNSIDAIVDGNKSDIRIGWGNSNIVIIFKMGESQCFYKLCMRHTSISDYCLKGLNLFIYQLKKDRYDYNEIDAFQKEAEQCISTIKFARSIRKLPTVVEKYAGANKYSSFIIFDKNILKEFGMESLAFTNRKILGMFVKFMYCLIRTYNKYSYCKRNSIENRNYCNYMATYCLARLLGLPNLVVFPLKATLFINGVEYLGFYTEYVGKVAKFCNTKITTDMQSQLCALNLLDGVSLELDHGPGNYALCADRGWYAGVCAFDNDGNYTFSLKSASVFSSELGADPLIVGGEYNRRFCNKEFYDKLAMITFRELKYCFKDYLTNIQLVYMWKRTQNLLKAIDRSVLKGKCTQIQNNEWSEATIQQEFSFPAMSYLKVLDKFLQRNSNET